jgi:hypothetical protein
MTLRLTEGEYYALRQHAKEEGLPMQRVIHRALREHLDFVSHRDKVVKAADEILAKHADALDQLR